MAGGGAVTRARVRGECDKRRRGGDGRSMATHHLRHRLGGGEFQRDVCVCIIRLRMWSTTPTTTCPKKKIKRPTGGLGCAGITLCIPTYPIPLSSLLSPSEPPLPTACTIAFYRPTQPSRPTRVRVVVHFLSTLCVYIRGLPRAKLNRLLSIK